MSLCNSNIIRKLTAPFINDKILQQAEHCSIACSSISEPGFDFIMSRVSKKCTIDIVTGLGLPATPHLLKKIFDVYPSRVTAKIHTRNIFNANLYIFDLPFRKSIAFTSSAPFTLGGLKDDEQLSLKVNDQKEIEALKSWYVGYFEYAEPLSEYIITEYEQAYPLLKEREIASRFEREQMMDSIIHRSSWETMRLNNQYFKKEDYLTFENGKAPFTTADIQSERMSVHKKLLDVHSSLKNHLTDFNVHANSDPNQIISSLDPIYHVEHKLRSMWIAYGRSDAELIKYDAAAKLQDFITLQIIIKLKEVTLCLMPGKRYGGKEDRTYFLEKMKEPAYRSTFFKLLTALGPGYRIEIAGERRKTDTLQTEDALWEFTMDDDWKLYDFNIYKNYLPDDKEISVSNITPVFIKEFDKLTPLYNHLKAPLM